MSYSVKKRRVTLTRLLNEIIIFMILNITYKNPCKRENEKYITLFLTHSKPAILIMGHYIRIMPRSLPIIILEVLEQTNTEERIGLGYKKEL